MLFGVIAGVVLLVLLAFAVAYASGWGQRAPTAATAPTDAEGASNISMERKMQAVLAAVLGVGGVMLLYGINEPNRQATAFQRQRVVAEHRGEHAYAQLCSGC